MDFLRARERERQSGWPSLEKSSPIGRYAQGLDNISLEDFAFEEMISLRLIDFSIFYERCGDEVIMVISRGKNEPFYRMKNSNSFALVRWKFFETHARANYYSSVWFDELGAYSRVLMGFKKKAYFRHFKQV